MPLWWSQFLSALNDNLFRLGLSAALAFGVIATSQRSADLIISLSPAIFILPYLVISGISGQLADKFSRSKLLRWNRGLEIFVFGLSAYALLTAQIPLLIVCLVMVGALAAFYGPVKLAITPELVRVDQLIAANGAIESGTYAAILLGTLVGTSLMGHRHLGLYWTVALIMGIGVAAWIFSLLTPNTAAPDPGLKIDWNVPVQSWSLVRWGAEDRTKTILLMGNGWFWFVGTAVLSQLTIFVKVDLHSVADLNTVFLTLFAIGIGLGSWLCNYLLRGMISIKFSSVSALGMAVSALLLAVTAYVSHSNSSTVISVGEFMSHPLSWVMLISVVSLSAFAGLFVVPMVTMMQTCVPDEQTAKLLSLSNIWFAIFIIAGSLLSTLILSLHGSPTTIFAVVGVMTLFVAGGLRKLCSERS
jgi:acyl-[acyl-carrier-protein]-phospholipid O-acyltransferase / long-chain-fatty-acid--[acyl-carrier-protein] ligase